MPSTTLNAGYARYFSPPPFELLSVTTMDRFLVSVPRRARSDGISLVKAERDHYFDVGVTQKIAERLTAGIDGYYNSRNLVDIRQFGAPIVFTPSNYHMG